MPIFNWFKKKKPAETEETEMIQTSEADNTEAPSEETALSVTEETLVADEILDSEPEAHLTDMDFSDFWHDIKESERRYEAARPDLRLIRSVQDELGFVLPDTFATMFTQKESCPSTVL